MRFVACYLPSERFALRIPLPDDKRVGRSYRVFSLVFQKYYSSSFNIARSSSNCTSNINPPMTSLSEVKRIWKAADAVTLDVDSTVIKEEGIDELAKFCGVENKVVEVTKQAMQGNMTFQQSLHVRLNIIQPSLGQINKFLSTHPATFSSGIKALVNALHVRKKQVFLISGGFLCLIAPVAKELDIPLANVFANRLKFYYTGEYAGFDEKEPTSQSGGKASVIRHLKNDLGFKTVVHIGDGATDLETIAVADAFIGYGGNVTRESIKSQAPWFITDFCDLVKEL